MRIALTSRQLALALVLTAALASGLAAAESGRSATLPQSLQGESLAEDTVVQSGAGDFFAPNPSQVCDKNGTNTFHYSYSGTASGPYPGTFIAQLDITIGPQINPTDQYSGYYGLNTGAVTLTETFTITSGSTTITGTMSGNGDAVCGAFTGVQHGSIANWQGELGHFETTDSYTARIVTPNGSASDSGRSFGGAVHDVGCGDLNGGSGNFCTGSAAVNESFALSNGVQPLGPAAVSLSPADTVDAVGTTRNSAATVSDASGGPVANSRVLFSVQGSVTATGSCMTDSTGRCSFSYTGPQLPGADVITACADVNGNGAADAGEPCATATEAWVLPTTTPGHVTGGGQVVNNAGTDKNAFGFTAQSDSKGTKGECSIVDPTANLKIKCTDVTTLVRSGTHATFFGDATVNGAATTYRVDVDDLAEPGAGQDSFKIQTASGYSTGGVISNGNIQVH